MLQYRYASLLGTSRSRGRQDLLTSRAAVVVYNVLFMPHASPSPIILHPPPLLCASHYKDQGPVPYEYHVQTRAMMAHTSKINRERTGTADTSTCSVLVRYQVSRQKSTAVHPSTVLSTVVSSSMDNTQLVDDSYCREKRLIVDFLE